MQNPFKSFLIAYGSMLKLDNENTVHTPAFETTPRLQLIQNELICQTVPKATVNPTFCIADAHWGGGPQPRHEAWWRQCCVAEAVAATVPSHTRATVLLLLDVNSNPPPIFGKSVNLVRCEKFVVKKERWRNGSVEMLGKTVQMLMIAQTPSLSVIWPSAVCQYALY